MLSTENITDNINQVSNELKDEMPQSNKSEVLNNKKEIEFNDVIQELLKEKKEYKLLHNYILSLFNFLYGKEETQIIVSDNKDFVINSFLKEKY